MFTFELISWIGGFLLATCGVPLAYQVWKDKHANGIGLIFLTMWYTGELLVLIYVIHLVDWALIFNYGFNSVLLTYIMYHKLRMNK